MKFVNSILTLCALILLTNNILILTSCATLKIGINSANYLSIMKNKKHKSSPEKSKYLSFIVFKINK
jgi:hypothetical protein